MAINEMDARLISQGTQVESVGAEALIPVATAEGQPQKNIALSDLANSMGAQGSEVADIKSLWGQTEDGKMVQINKASIASVLGNLLYGADNKNDLASVVAEVMGTKLYPMIGGGTLLTDFNDVSTLCPKSGVYFIGVNNGNYENFPTEASGTKYGVFVHINLRDWDLAKLMHITQFYFDYQGKIFYRNGHKSQTSTSISWSGWGEIGISTATAL